MEKSNEEEIFKEYFNLNGYYLKIYLGKEEIFLICYNSTLLDGIKYEKIINSEKINKNDKNKNISNKELYEIIVHKIEQKNYTINLENKSINLTLYKDYNNNTNLYLKIILNKTHQHIKNEYESVLSKTILNLREENKIMRNEIAQIKTILSKMNVGNEILTANKVPENSNDVSHNCKTEIKLRGKKNNINPSMIPLKNNNDNNNNNLNSNDNNTKNTNVKNPKTDLLRKNVAYQNPINNSLTISALANLEYGFYPKVELSANSIFKISGYGANSYNGIVRNYNEDKLKIILDYKLNRTIKNAQGNIINPTISFFGLYDGHGGNKCSNFLQENFASFLFNSEYFPSDTIQAINEAYTKSENEFKAIALDPKNNKLLDKSGSCSLTALIIDEWCFISYLGDSRGLYSFDSGNQFYQVTRDHKPNDPIERTRIEKAGGSVYKDDRVKINGQKVHVKEENLAPGLSFPYRVSPGNLAVNNIL